MPRYVEQGEDAFSRRRYRRPLHADNGAEGEGSTGEAETNSFCVRKPGTVRFGRGINLESAGRERRQNREAGEPTLSMPDRDALRRMESIRRGDDGDRRSALVNGVKANRRGYLQGGKTG